MDREKRVSEAKTLIDSMRGLPDVHMRRGTAHSGDALTGIVDYNYQLFRDSETKRFTFYVEWVDLDGSGNRVYLPNEVVTALFNARDALIGKSRSEGAKKAIETRKREGTYKPPTPPVKKKKASAGEK